MIRAGKLAGHRTTCLTPAELHPSTTITRRSPPLFEQLTAEQQDALVAALPAIDALTRLAGRGEVREPEEAQL